MKSRLHGGWKGAALQPALRRDLQRHPEAARAAVRLAPAGVLPEVASARTGEAMALELLKAHAYGNDFLYLEAEDLERPDGPGLAQDAVRAPHGRRRRRPHPLPDDRRRRRHAALQRGRQLLRSVGQWRAGPRRRVLLEPRARGAARARVAASSTRMPATSTSRCCRPSRLASCAGPPWGTRPTSGWRRSTSGARRSRPSCSGWAIRSASCSRQALDEERYRRLGAALEHHPFFPEGTNVEFAVRRSARASSAS